MPNSVEAEDLEHLPSIGNGHVATVVYSDSVFLNGLYNGKNGNSHRAEIPSGNKIRVNFPKEKTDGNSMHVNQHKLTLDVGRAIFIESWNVSVGNEENEEIYVEQRTFAHSYFTSLIVTQIEVTSRNLKDYITLELSSGNFDDYTNSDLRIMSTGEVAETSLSKTRFMCAEVLEKENDNDGGGKIMPTACTITSYVPSTLTISRRFPKITKTFITGYGSDLESIKADFNDVAELIFVRSHDFIIKRHVKTWQNIFFNGDRGKAAIQVEGNTKLAKLVNGCFYYILSSLPFPSLSNNQFPHSQSFNGLSPSGLPYGSKGTNYQGHSFWDTETWMFPPILYFYPEAAKEILNYRLARIQGARNKARKTGYKGARFPWESASTGEEVSPENLSEGARSQVHITSDISFAVRLYIAMTRDIESLKEQQKGYLTNGCGLLKDIAEFWVSRAKYNISTGYHEIDDVMSPDEDHRHGKNNGFTNIGAGYSIFYAQYANCLCDNSSSVPDTWLDIAKSLKLLIDKDRNYHPEYEGYQLGTPIKQADVILMGYPLLYEMPLETRRNDIKTYIEVSRENGPAMTWSMHTIAFLELDDFVQAENMFNRSYQWYVEEPFKIWLECLPWRVPPSEHQPAVNFLTGMGGFLQSIFNGYGGLRVYPEKIVMRKPRLVPGTTGLVFRGIKYLENVIDIKVSETTVKLIIIKRSYRFPLQVSENGNEPVSFVSGTLEYLTVKERFSLEITTTTPTYCTLPEDKIGTASKNPETKSSSDNGLDWWKKLKPARRRHKYESNFSYHLEGFYDNKGCSVPLYVKPKAVKY